MIIPLYQGTKQQKKSSTGLDEILAAYQIVLSDLKPDWSGVWVLPECLRWEEIGDRYETYPGVALVAKVESIKK